MIGNRSNMQSQYDTHYMISLFTILCKYGFSFENMFQSAITNHVTQVGMRTGGRTDCVVIGHVHCLTELTTLNLNWQNRPLGLFDLTDFTWLTWPYLTDWLGDWLTDMLLEYLSISMREAVNLLRQRQNRRHFADIFKCIFLIEI